MWPIVLSIFIHKLGLVGSFTFLRVVAHTGQSEGLRVQSGPGASKCIESAATSAESIRPGATPDDATPDDALNFKL